MTEWLPFHFSLSCIGEGNGNPLQCSFLENSRDGGAWWAAVYGVAQSRTRLKWLSSSSNLCWVPAGRCVRHSSKHVRGVITISSATPWSWYCYSIIKVEKLGKEGFSNFLNITLLVSGSGYEDGQESDHKKGEIHCYQWKLILLLHNRPQ